MSSKALEIIWENLWRQYELNLPMSTLRVNFFWWSFRREPSPRKFLEIDQRCKVRLMNPTYFNRRYIFILPRVSQRIHSLEDKVRQTNDANRIRSASVFCRVEGNFPTDNEANLLLGASLLPKTTCRHVQNCLLGYPLYDSVSTFVYRQVPPVLLKSHQKKFGTFQSIMYTVFLGMRWSQTSICQTWLLYGQ